MTSWKTQNAVRGNMDIKWYGTFSKCYDLFHHQIIVLIIILGKKNRKSLTMHISF